MIFSRNDKVLHYIGIPKTGSTSITNLLISAGWELIDKRYGIESRHEPWAVWHERLKGVNIDHELAVVRDPVSRFHSKTYSNLSNELGLCDNLIQDENLMTLNAHQALTYMLPEFGPDYYNYHYLPQHCFMKEQTKVYKIEKADMLLSDLRDAEIISENAHLEHANRSNNSRNLKIDFEYKNLKEAFLGWYEKDYHIFDYHLDPDNL